MPSPEPLWASKTGHRAMTDSETDRHHIQGIYKTYIKNFPDKSRYLETSVQIYTLENLSSDRIATATKDKKRAIIVYKLTIAQSGSLPLSR